MVSKFNSLKHESDCDRRNISFPILGTSSDTIRSHMCLTTNISWAGWRFSFSGSFQKSHSMSSSVH
jgi:hypothetical protein